MPHSRSGQSLADDGSRQDRAIRDVIAQEFSTPERAIPVTVSREIEATFALPELRRR